MNYVCTHNTCCARQYICICIYVADFFSLTTQKIECVLRFKKRRLTTKEFLMR